MTLYRCATMPCTSEIWFIHVSKSFKTRRNIVASQSSHSGPVGRQSVPKVVFGYPRLLYFWGLYMKDNISVHMLAYFWELEIILKYEFYGLKVRICDKLCSKLIKGQFHIYSHFIQ